jgi:hypothetical protein
MYFTASQYYIKDLKNRYSPKQFEWKLHSGILQCGRVRCHGNQVEDSYTDALLFRPALAFAVILRK